MQPKMSSRSPTKSSRRNKPWVGCRLFRGWCGWHARRQTKAKLHVVQYHHRSVEKPYVSLSNGERSLFRAKHPHPLRASCAYGACICPPARNCPASRGSAACLEVFLSICCRSFVAADGHLADRLRILGTCLTDFTFNTVVEASHS